MADIIATFISFSRQLFALPFPGLGVPFIVVAAGFLLLNFLFWLLSRLGGGGD